MEMNMIDLNNRTVVDSKCLSQINTMITAKKLPSQHMPHAYSNLGKYSDANLQKHTIYSRTVTRF